MKQQSKNLSIVGLLFTIIPLIFGIITSVLKIKFGYPLQHIISAITLLCLLIGFIISVSLIRKPETRNIISIITTVISGFYMLIVIVLIVIVIVIAYSRH